MSWRISYYCIKQFSGGKSPRQYIIRHARTATVLSWLSTIGKAHCCNRWIVKKKRYFIYIEQVLIKTAESTWASMDRMKMPNLRNGSKGGIRIRAHLIASPAFNCWATALHNWILWQMFPHILWLTELQKTGPIPLYSTIIIALNV